MCEVERKKRKRGEKMLRFKRFGENGYPAEFVGPFRENMRALLEFGHYESKLWGGFQSWSFQLEVHRHPPFHVLLFVVEEPIEASPTRHCKQCQYVGWGQHMICNKKYHFVLPSKDTMMAAAACWECKSNSNASANTNSSCSVGMNNRHRAAGSGCLVELQGHILHGVFHSNGFGHLLCVNGLQTGSTLPGYHLMEFWDRLCNGLRARKVSLNDSSEKRGMELRLIHGVAYGQPWFGRWGYKFGRGAFSVSQQMYKKAIEAIQGIPLSLLLHHLGSSLHELTIIFSKYQTLSDHSLVNLRDLFHFMLELHSRFRSQNSIDTSNGVSAFLLETSCRWSPKRVEMAVRVIIQALKRAEFRWVSRQEVRDAARLYIGDTGLLDFVLKSLGNHIVGNYLVRRTLNPVTKVLEYCLQDVCNVFPHQENLAKSKPTYGVGRIELMKDIFNLYRFVLRDQNPSPGKEILSALSVASGIVLDSKFLVKEYSGELPSEAKLNLYCTVRFKGQEILGDGVAVPYECVELKNNATIDELKVEVERNLREIYWGLKTFSIESISNLSAAIGSDLVFGVVEVGGKVVFNGDMGLCMELCESGKMRCVVDCVCGAGEDDGERMVSCDICEVWQHTRCVHIPNDQQIPNIFLCNRCEQEIALLPSLP